jgi:class 3 adenylate cyclase
MSRLEDQLTNAAEEARRHVAYVNTRSPSTVRARLHRHRAFAGAAIAAGVFALLGATAVIANNDGTPDFAAAPESTTVTASIPGTTAASPVSDAEPVDITHLVSSVVASSELSVELGADALVDGDLDRAWNDAALRGDGAEIWLEFDVPVAIDHVTIHPLRDEEPFFRNFWIQDLEISTDDGENPVEVRFERVNAPHVVELGSAATTVLQLRVLTTYLAQPAGDKPPFNELAIAEIQVFGHPVDGDTAPEVAMSPTTTIVTAEPIEPSTPADLLGTWDWVETVTSIEAGESTWVNDLNGIRQKLTHIQETVPEIGAANGLMFRSTEWYEDAVFLLGDGSDTMVYIGWNELESTDPVSVDAWQEIRSSGIDPVRIVLPQIDPSMGQGLTDDVLVLVRMTDRAADFVADTATVVATVRFFQLADSYAALPIQETSDEMARIADAIFAAMDLPKGEPGDLAPG